MSAKSKLLDWIDYLHSASPATPYLALFKNLVAVAYAYLGGSDIDEAQHSARRTFDKWQADQLDGVREGCKPVPDREGAGSRREVVRYGHARRALYERAAGNVARMFFDVLGYHAFNRTDTLELTEPLPAMPPQDPEKLRALEARAQYLRVFIDPQPIAEQPLPGLDMVRQRIQSELEIRHLKAQAAGQQAEIDKLSQYISHRLDVVAPGPNAALAKGPGPGEAPAETGDGETDKFMISLLEADDETFGRLNPATRELLEPARNWMQRAKADGLSHEEAQQAVVRELRNQINPSSMRIATAAARRRGVIQ